MRNKKIIIGIAIAILAGVALVLSNNYEEKQKQESEIDIHGGAVAEKKEDKELMDIFKKNHDEEIITYAQQDMNNDGKDDLLVIYYVNKNSNQMTVVASKGDEYILTEPIPAPIDDQQISFKNIDDKDEMEVIVSGSKNGNVGYAIYRLEGNEMIDLFGQDMESCC